MNKLKSFGFTVIELLVVVSIIGVLASMITVNINDSRKKARDTKRIADLDSMKTALEIYNNQNGAYPDGGCVESGSSGWATLQTLLAPYLSKLPTADMSDHPYFYCSTDGTDFTLLMLPEDSNIISKGNGSRQNAAWCELYYCLQP